MKRVFKFKKGDYFDGDEDAIYHIFDALCGDNDKVKKDMKITIISEEMINDALSEREEQQ